MDQIDLRSDTVTWPTAQMRQAMMVAPVGDDVYGEDPTVNRLEAMAAERFGKEAGLLVTSGTMGNIIAILAHAGRGDEVIMGRNAHTYLYEAGNPATLGGVHTWTVEVHPDGTLHPDEIEAAIRIDDPHFPRTTLVCLENTQGSTGGQPLPTGYINQIGNLCRHHNLKLHIDGARIFNAAAALNEDVTTLTQDADSISFCLSKGLCAPVGSVLVGSQRFIDQARRVRKSLGGGMRQAGIIAAAGIVALEEMTARLTEDHTNAKRLAVGLAGISAIEVDVERVRTNILFYRLREEAPLSGAELVAKLAQENIRIGGFDQQGRSRLVTHYWIKPNHIELVIERMRSLLS